MDNCPKCKVSFIGGEIPKDQREFVGDATHWKREIGIDGFLLGMYDGTVAYKCPDCDHHFPVSTHPVHIEMLNEYMEYIRE